MPNNVLQIDDIIEYLNRQPGNQASTELINRNFLDAGYTKGQIAGVLYRRYTDKIFEKPCRAVYKLADTTAVEILKDKINEIKYYIETLPYKYYQNMDNREKQEFDKLANLINLINLE